MKTLSFLHRWSGGFIGLLLAILGLSGTILLWEGEWISLPGADDVPVEQVQTLGMIAEREAAAGATRITFASDELGLLHVVREGGAGAYLKQDGTLVASWSSQWERPELWIFDLHHHLFAGRNGELVAGWAGVFGLVFVVTGSILWWRSRRSFKLRLLPRKFQPGPIVSHHRDIGIIVAPLLLITFVTGTGMVFRDAAGVVLRPFGKLEGRSKPPKVDAAEGPAPIAAMLAEAKARYPDAELRRLMIPAKPDQPYSVRLRQPFEWTANGRTSLSFDGTGKLVKVDDPATRKPGLGHPREIPADPLGQGGRPRLEAGDDLFRPRADPAGRARDLVLLVPPGEEAPAPRHRVGRPGSRRRLGQLRDDPQRPAAAVLDLDRQRDDRRARRRQLLQPGYILESRNVRAEQDPMRDEVLRLAIVEARRVEPDRGNLALLDQEAGNLFRQPREVQLGDRVRPPLVGAHIGLPVGPKFGKAGMEQHDRPVRKPPVGFLPLFDIGNREAIIAVRRALLRHIDHRTRSDQPVEWDLVGRRHARREMDRRVEMRPAMFREAQIVAAVEPAARRLPIRRHLMLIPLGGRPEGRILGQLVAQIDPAALGPLRLLRRAGGDAEQCQAGEGVSNHLSLPWAATKHIVVMDAICA